MRPALGGDEHRLAGAVRLEDGGAERALDRRAVVGVEGFGGAQDVRVGPVAHAALDDPPRKAGQRLGVSDDAVRTALRDRVGRGLQRRVVLGDGVDVLLAAERAIHPDLAGVPALGHDPARAPVVQRREAHSVPSPAVPAETGGLPPRLALVAVLEAQRRAARAARPFADVGRGARRVDEIVDPLAHRLAREHRQLGEIRATAQGARVEAPLSKELAPVRDVAPGVGEQCPQRLDLNALERLRVEPLRPLEAAQIGADRTPTDEALPRREEQRLVGGRMDRVGRLARRGREGRGRNAHGDRRDCTARTRAASTAGRSTPAVVDGGAGIRAASPPL